MVYPEPATTGRRSDAQREEVLRAFGYFEPSSGGGTAYVTDADAAANEVFPEGTLVVFRDDPGDTGLLIVADGVNGWVDIFSAVGPLHAVFNSSANVPGPYQTHFDGRYVLQ